MKFPSFKLKQKDDLILNWIPSRTSRERRKKDLNGI